MFVALSFTGDVFFGPMAQFDAAVFSCEIVMLFFKALSQVLGHSQVEVYNLLYHEWIY